MKKQPYANSEEYIRRNLYIHSANSRDLDVAAAEDQTDPSQILNLALALYFKNNRNKRK